MTQAACDIASDQALAGRPPGFLLAPFGWATERLIQLLQCDPALLVEVLHLSRIRMHLIALALAHHDSQVPPELGRVLLRGTAGDILDSVLARRPTGLKRVVRGLPERVLEAASYRRLVRLLDEPAAAKMLHHAEAIDDGTIEMIESVPAALREAVLAMQDRVRGIEALADGLHCLVRRGAAADFDTLVDELSPLRQPEQLVAKVGTLVEALPLPDALPPVCVGYARRIDRAAELRELGKRWRNCLGEYVWRVDGGDCAIYLWEHAGIEAACLLERHGRLGWFLHDVRGPRNSAVDPPHLDAIAEAFEMADLPPRRRIKAIEDMIDMAGVRRLRRHPRRRPVAQDEPDATLLMDLA